MPDNDKKDDLIGAAAAIAENVAAVHRVRENITAHYVGCSCGIALSHLSYAAHVAHETIATLAAADLLRSTATSELPAVTRREADAAGAARDTIARIFMGARDVTAVMASGLDYHRADLAIEAVWLAVVDATTPPPNESEGA